MTKPERERKAREIIAATGADTEEHFKKVEAVNLGVTFRRQAEWWLNHVQTRKRKPVKPKTVASWQDCLRKWLNPHLGDMALPSINNLAVKPLVSKMAEAGLPAKSIITTWRRWFSLASAVPIVPKTLTEKNRESVA